MQIGAEILSAVNFSLIKEMCSDDGTLALQWHSGLFGCANVHKTDNRDSTSTISRPEAYSRGSSLAQIFEPSETQRV